MFKNRLRTAALAGAIAVATGISGMAVPAMAQNVNNGDHFNQQDGSAPQTGENRTEIELEAATAAITSFLESERGARIDVRGAYLDAFSESHTDDVLDPSEQNIKAAFDLRLSEITERLATASKNVADARASVRYALDADEAAVQAYDNLDDFMTGLNATQIAALNALIQKINDENLSALDDLTLLSNPSNAQEALRLERELSVHELWIGNHPNADESEENYISRNHQLAIDALRDSALGSELFELVRTARDAAEHSQRSDVLVRQLLLEQATAQVQVLRAIQADYNVVARFVDLYENDAAYEDQAAGWKTLRQLYRETLSVTDSAVNQNLIWVDEINVLVNAGFISWETDLGNMDEYTAYQAARLAEATELNEKLLINADWQNAAAKAALLDSAFSNESAAAAEEEAAKQAEEAKKAAEEAEAQRKAEADRLAKILEELAKQKDQDNTPAPTEPSAPAASSGSSENTGIIGLIAAIGGIIGLIAVGFPFIQDFLR